MPKPWLICCNHQQKTQKIANFYILMIITLAVNIIIRKVAPFFSVAIWALSIDVIHFCISRSSKISSLGSSFYIRKMCQGWQLKSDSHPPIKICPLKLMKNAFNFMLKALFVLKIFKFLLWLYGHLEKTAWLEK